MINRSIEKSIIATLHHKIYRGKRPTNSLGLERLKCDDCIGYYTKQCLWLAGPRFFTKRRSLVGPSLFSTPFYQKPNPKHHAPIEYRELRIWYAVDRLAFQLHLGSIAGCQSAHSLQQFETLLAAVSFVRA